MKISRKEAKEKGLKYYYTGKPCPHNHISKRATHNATCYECKCNSRRIATKKHYGTNRAKASRYKTKKLKATPSWADLEAITEFYRNCPKDMVVDHIVPLQGKLVSGLHVLENLQYLTPQENAIKYNTFIIEEV